MAVSTKEDTIIIYHHLSILYVLLLLLLLLLCLKVKIQSNSVEAGRVGQLVVVVVVV